MELIKNIDDVYTYYNKQRDIKANTIKKAINASYNMLTLDEFVEVSEFKMPDIGELNCIRQLKAGVPVLITKQMVKAFGYSGTYSDQKRNLLKLIKSHKLSYTLLTNAEYKQFMSDFEAREESDLPQDLYPVLSNVGRSTHILMMPRDLNKLMMVVNTNKGDVMREFCQTLAELFDLYLKYQSEYKSQQLTIKDKRIDELLSNVKEMRADIKDMHSDVNELKKGVKDMHSDLKEMNANLDEMNSNL